jgi:nanoRNase/pAp phosphatase (c-di-AMP/oligoRNAs hydrolase)
MTTTDEVASWVSDLEFLKGGEKDHVAIVCHDQPDPDCLASALAMQAIASHFGLASTIYYGGEIGHTQNRVMVNVLNIVSQRFDLDDTDEDSKRQIEDRLQKSYIVLVDVAHFGRQPCEAVGGFVKDREPDLVIDHHEPNPKLTCRYIRRPYGSCSTILFKMLVEMQVPISKTLATALYVGISTDTANLQAEGVAPDDRDVFESLKSLIDPEAYEKILNYPRSVAIIDMRRRVYNTLQVFGNLAVANAGIISVNQRSLIAELCDELLQVESLETAVVMAIVDEGVKGDKYLVASFRSQVLALNMNDFIGKTFGKKFGGGRKGAGAARVPVDPILKTVIDDIRANKGDNGYLDGFTQPIFHAYAEKVRSENGNI